MNIRTRAALYTLGFIGGSIVVSLIISFIASNVPGQYLFYGFIGLMAMGLIYIIYSLMLSRLEYFEKIGQHISEIEERTKKY